MTEIPGMILWTDDYLGDTGHLTVFEHGAYLLILMAMWRNGGKLAKDSKRLALVAKTPPGHWTKIEKTIMDFMTLIEEPNGEVYITQGRLRKEYLQALGRNLKRVEAGRLGGLAKSLKTNELVHSKANGNGKAMPEQRYTTTIPILKKDSFLQNEAGKKDKPEATSTNGQVYVNRDSPQWWAWYAHRMKKTCKSPPIDKQGGWWFPSEYPPTEDVT